MALYTTFGELLTRLRSETGQSTNPGVGSGANDRHKTILNRVYETLFDAHDWRHLTHITTRTTLPAGSRYADIPSSIDYNTFQKVVAWLDSIPYPLEPGIGPDEYATFDSAAGERSDPPFRYDLRATGTGVTQIEIWPVPASNEYTLELTGKRKWQRLVNSIDICLIDDTLVVLYAAEAILRRINTDDADSKLSAAKQRLIDLKSNGTLPHTDGSAMPRLGAGDPVVSMDRGRATVRISRG